MNTRTLKLIACSLLVAAPPAMRATPTQTHPARNQKRTQTQTRKRSDEARAGDVERRAVAALIEAAQVARSISALNDSVEIRTEAADALWPFDSGAARAILRSAWEAAADAETRAEDEKLGDVEFEQRRIIAVAARHDARLAESFLKEMARDDATAADAGETARDAEEEGSPRNDNSSPGASHRPSEMNKRRLSIAFSLLDRGDFKSAAQLAAPAVAEGVSHPLIFFINALRAVAPSEADALHLRLIEKTRSDPSSDANDILMLSAITSYGGDFFAVVAHDGSTQFLPAHGDVGPARPPRPAIAQHVRNAFFDAAARVLSRNPAARGGGGSQSSAHAASYFFAMRRLLPLFEREAPHHLPLLNARMVTLAQELNERQRDSLIASARALDARADNPRDPIWFDVGNIEHAEDDAARDRMRLRAVFNASRKRLWGRAKELADQITDAETRRAARNAIVIEQVLSIFEAFKSDDSEDSFERAAGFVRAADAPPEARSAGLAQAADLAARRGDARRALELFDEASLLSTNVHEPHLRIGLLLLSTDVASRVSPPRAWEKMSQLTSKVNEIDVKRESGPCQGRVAVEMPGDDTPHCIPLPLSNAKLADVYATMARLDSARALDEARALKETELRARATVAAARAALEKLGRGARSAR